MDKNITLPPKNARRPNEMQETSAERRRFYLQDGNKIETYKKKKEKGGRKTEKQSSVGGREC